MRNVQITGEYTIGIGIGFDPDSLIIATISYVENKRVWSGVIFNQHHYPILAIYKIEFFDLSFLPDDGWQLDLVILVL